MSIQSLTDYVVIPTSGTYTVIVSDTFEKYLFTGTRTLVAGYSITVSGSPVETTKFVIQWRARATYSGANVVTVLGVALTQAQALSDLDITCEYLNGAWTVSISSINIAGTEYQGSEVIAVPTSGTLTLVAGTNKVNQRFTGTQTLVGNYVVTASSPTTNVASFYCIWNCVCTVAGSSVTIFGVTLTDEQALSGNVVVNAVWDSVNAVWVGNLLEGEIYPNSIPNTALAKMPALSIKANATNTTADSQDLVASVGSTVLKRNAANALVFEKVKTADIDNSAITATEIAANAVVTAKILAKNVTLAKIQDIAAYRILGNNTGSSATPIELTVAQVQTLLGIGTTPVLYTQKVNITSAQILACNGTPIPLVAAPGAGKIIKAIGAFYTLTYNSVAYATNTDMEISHGPSYKCQLIDGGGFANSNSGNYNFAYFSNGNLVENAPLYLTNSGGNPTAGNSDIVMYVQYLVITL